MPTIKDIAREAGVSHGTVSNVINGRGNVSVEKIRLVWQAAEKLGYKVNTKAQSLRLGKDHAIAVLLPGIEYTHWAAMYEVFQSEFTQRGYSVQLYSTRSIESSEQAMLTEALNARVSAIITKCGEMVNTVPAEAEMQLMVRAASLDAMLDSSRKVDRALKAGALAIGGKVEIQNQIGYLPLHSSRELTAVYKENVKNYLGCTDSAFIPQYVSAGSTDLGDISHIVPCMHIWTGGISGALHASDFKVTDQEAAFILPAKMMAMTVIDLLFDKAGCAKAVMDAFHPVFTKEEYLAFLREHSGLDFFDGSTL